MKKTIAGVILTTVALVGATVMQAEMSASQTQTQRIEEDDPRWDCHTMGNRICGPNHG